eukprot:Hpha_TRINITY_DN16629_c3_g9::TRINITY_DN16629_c3_g9_i2::g.183012::m.183012
MRFSPTLGYTLHLHYVAYPDGSWWEYNDAKGRQVPHAEMDALRAMCASASTCSSTRRTSELTPPTAPIIIAERTQTHVMESPSIELGSDRLSIEPPVIQLSSHHLRPSRKARRELEKKLFPENVAELLASSPSCTAPRCSTGSRIRRPARSVPSSEASAPFKVSANRDAFVHSGGKDHTIVRRAKASTTST